MYYEERVINDKLMYRTIPNGVWYEVSNVSLTRRLLEAESELNTLRGQVK